MRICILVEGSYPYVVGGVSSWIQMLISGMPEHEFIIYSIGAEEKARGQFRYTLPENIAFVKELFLDSILRLKSPEGGVYKLRDDEKKNLEALICGDAIDIAKLIGTFYTAQGKKDPMEMFMNFEFFDVLSEAYRKKFDYLPFTDYFWTIRSMLLPMFYLICQDLPEADLYHSVATGYCGAVGALASIHYKKPFLVTEHGIYSREREEEIIKCDWAKGEFKSLWIQYFYNLAKLTYDHATRVITLFSKNAEIEAALGCDPAKIQIVPNGIRTERFSSMPLPTQNKDALTVGAVVRVAPVKDIVTMLRSFYLVKKALPKTRFLIIGPCDEDAQYYETCRKLVDTLEIRDVEFTGSVDVQVYLPQTDILVLSSISEGQPLAVIEGMAAARPFVCTDVGCCRELLHGEAGDDLGEAGVIVPVMDFEGMAEAIVRLAEDGEMRIRMGGIGRQRVLRDYTFEGFISAYREIYAAAYAGKERASTWRVSDLS